MQGCSGGGGGEVGGVSIWVESEAVAPGGTARAWLVISDASGVAGLDLDLAFDSGSLSVLEDDPVGTTPLTQDFAVACNNQTPGSLTVFMANATGVAGGESDELIEMTFVVDPGIPSGTRIPLSFDSLRVYDDAPSQIMLSQVSDGEIRVE
jgi:hypothetical protein